MLLTLLAIVWLLIWLLAVVDIVRRHDLRTSSKVLWALAVIFVPSHRRARLPGRAPGRRHAVRAAGRPRASEATLRMRAPATAIRSDLAHHEGPR